MKHLTPKDVAIELGCSMGVARKHILGMTVLALGPRLVRVHPTSLLKWAADNGRDDVAQRMAARLVESLPVGDACWVYFVSSVGGGPVKIGIADVLKDRLRILQTGNPQRLEVVAAMRGTRSTESALHEAFEHDRLVGEWFGDTPAIRTVARCVGLPTGFSVREEQKS